jgi:hypothetical protein
VASRIEAIIFDGFSTRATLPAVKVVRLAAELTMLPVTDDLVDRLDPAAVGDNRIPANWELQQPVAALARSISAGRTALYIINETFGGPGTSEAIAWKDGELLYGPAGTCDIEPDLQSGYQLARSRDSAVNVGLRAIGVCAAGDEDEYATAGLTRHRMTEDWLRD